VSLSGGPQDDGHSRLIGFMLDGVPIYAFMDGVDDLDECGGHVDEGRPFYHYHAAGTMHPYTVPCLRGCLRPEYVRGMCCVCVFYMCIHASICGPMPAGMSVH
jgi:hypothetical protein